MSLSHHAKTSAEISSLFWRFLLFRNPPVALDPKLLPRDSCQHVPIVLAKDFPIRLKRALLSAWVSSFGELFLHLFFPPVKPPSIELENHVPDPRLGSD